jgi:hypothetical protein
MLEPSMGKIAKSVHETNKIQFEIEKIRYRAGDSWENINLKSFFQTAI